MTGRPATVANLLRLHFCISCKFANGALLHWRFGKLLSCIFEIRCVRVGLGGQLARPRLRGCPPPHTLPFAQMSKAAHVQCCQRIHDACVAYAAYVALLHVLCCCVCAHAALARSTLARLLSLQISMRCVRCGLSSGSNVRYSRKAIAPLRTLHTKPMKRMLPMLCCCSQMYVGLYAAIDSPNRG